ncbi:hypothetical protein QJS10_CPB15g01328 [Acorus calamus]|uniref:Uncharacterized protein n=1 Tax=Acorus calamus TaxID=4465 RepID=A0AAV9D803_ACOCL|nr:hypothetical protein QJS10_CPB15g01328 [Acorus calamus]
MGMQENGSSESTIEQELEKDQSSPPFPTSSSSPLSRSSSRYISYCMKKISTSPSLPLLVKQAIQLDSREEG